MYYESATALSHKEVKQAFASGEIEKICRALVSLAFYEADWRWAQEQFLFYTAHPSAQVRGVAVICLGHLARLHGILDKEIVLPTLNRLLNDPTIAGKVEDALDDMKIYLN